MFLEKLYNQLNIKNICNNIQDKYKLQFDLNEILSHLFFARFIYPSNKLETFKQWQNLIKQPNFQLYDKHRALSYLTDNIDLVRKKHLKTVKNSKKNKNYVCI